MVNVTSALRPATGPLMGSRLVLEQTTAREGTTDGGAAMELN